MVWMWSVRGVRDDCNFFFLEQLLEWYDGQLIGRKAVARVDLIVGRGGQEFSLDVLK